MLDAINRIDFMAWGEMFVASELSIISSNSRCLFDSMDVST